MQYTTISVIWQILLGGNIIEQFIFFCFDNGVFILYYNNKHIIKGEETNGAEMLNEDNLINMENKVNLMSLTKKKAKGII